MTYEKAIEVIKKNKPTSDPRLCGQELCLACDIAMESIEKQIPKRPVYSDYDDNGFDEIIPNEARCPVCGYKFEFGMWNEFDNPYCYCGQAIDWSE